MWKWLGVAGIGLALLAPAVAGAKTKPRFSPSYVKRSLKFDYGRFLYNQQKAAHRLRSYDSVNVSCGAVSHDAATCTFTLEVLQALDPPSPDIQQLPQDCTQTARVTRLNTKARKKAARKRGDYGVNYGVHPLGAFYCSGDA